MDPGHVIVSESYWMETKSALSKAVRKALGITLTRKGQLDLKLDLLTWRGATRRRRQYTPSKMV